MEADGPAPQDAQAFIAALDEVDLARYRVVGTYARYEETVRNTLQDARQKILAGFQPPGRKRENHLIWAARGPARPTSSNRSNLSLESALGQMI